MRQKSAIQSLEVLYGGSGWDEKRNFLVSNMSSDLIEIPYLSYLLRTKEGNVLFDTGTNPANIDKVVTKNIVISEDDLIINRLKQTGIDKKDINILIISHLHWDHSGFIRDFPYARILIQRAEYIFAMNPPPYAKKPYFQTDFNLPNYKWELLDGDNIVLPGLAVVFTPGHTPGHQSLFVDLPRTGPMILAADSCFLMENLETETLPATRVNSENTLLSYKKLKFLTKLTGAQFIPGHDVEVLKKMKLSPYKYE